MNIIKGISYLPIERGVLANSVIKRSTFVSRWMCWCPIVWGDRLKCEFYNTNSSEEAKLEVSFIFSSFFCCSTLRLISDVTRANSGKALLLRGTRELRGSQPNRGKVNKIARFYRRRKIQFSHLNKKRIIFPLHPCHLPESLRSTAGGMRGCRNLFSGGERANSLEALPLRLFCVTR